MENPGEGSIKYIANQWFGYDVGFEGYLELIKDYLTKFNLSKNYLYNKQLLIELYETKFGIRDHVNNGGGLASVTFNESEQYLHNYLYEKYLSSFMYRKIGEKLNISFDDYIDRPRYDIEAINKVADKLDKEKNDASGDALGELENEYKNSKK